MGTRETGYRLLAIALFNLFCVTRPGLSADDFIEEIPITFVSGWTEVKGNSRWEGGKPVVGGLGFNVVLDGWPRLLQRASFDHLDGRTGNRAAYHIMAMLDLGQVRTGGEPIGTTSEAASWCTRQYSIGAGTQALRFFVSRLTPAFLCLTSSPTLDLFAGEKWLGQAPQAHYISALPGIRDKASTTAVPKYMACVTGRKVIVRETGGVLSLADLAEPWALFWYGESAPFYRTRVPNLFYRGSKLQKFMATDYFVPADLPTLVTFQKKPAQIIPTEDALRVAWGADGAGAVTLTPLLGFYHPPAELTAAWRDGIPEDIIARCRTWTQRLKAFPVACTESRRVGPDAARVSIRQRYTYLDLPDDWQTPVEKLAPVPAVVAIAKRYGFPIELRDELAPYAIPTHSGPYTGIPATDTVEFTVPGLNKYVVEECASPVPESPEGRELVDELQREVAGLVAAGELSPGMAPSSGHTVPPFHFANPGETLLALAEAMPYLDNPARKAVADYAVEFLKLHNPLQTSKVNNFGAARREYHPLLTPEEFAKVSDVQQAGKQETSPVSREQRANNAYALWALARATGRWDIIKHLWEDIKAAADSSKPLSDWATCGHLYQYGENHGSTEAVNGQFARWVAMARMATRMGDRQAEEHAAYMLLRAALVRFAQGKLIRYMYDEKIQTIDTTPDWMYRISDEEGQSSGDMLWTEHWAGADDDVRQVIQWDEFGPVIGQLYHDWDPVMPAFQELTPECGRFLGDYLQDESARFVRAVELNAPDWHITRRQSYVGEEQSVDSPRNSYSVFLAKCYVLGADGKEMLAYQDVPYFKIGDLYHIRRLVANLRCLGGSLRWEKEAAQ